MRAILEARLLSHIERYVSLDLFHFAVSLAKAMLVGCPTWAPKEPWRDDSP
jgi:hypothetical protein